MSLPRSGRIVGAVTGNPTLTTERRTFLGQRALVVASTLAMMMSLALLLAAGPGAIGPLLAPIIMVMLLGAVSGLFGRTGALVKRTVKTIQRMSRSLVKGVTAAAQKTSAHDLPARRFRLTPVAGGGLIDCVMYGEPQGTGLRHGDFVTVTARRTRTGHYVVRRVEVMASPTGPVVGHVTGRPSVRFRIAQFASRLSFMLTSLITLWVAVVLVRILF